MPAPSRIQTRRLLGYLSEEDEKRGSERPEKMPILEEKPEAMEQIAATSFLNPTFIEKNRLRSDGQR